MTAAGQSGETEPDWKEDHTQAGGIPGEPIKVTIGQWADYYTAPIIRISGRMTLRQIANAKIEMLRAMEDYAFFIGRRMLLDLGFVTNPNLITFYAQRRRLGRRRPFQSPRTAWRITGQGAIR